MSWITTMILVLDCRIEVDDVFTLFNHNNPHSPSSSLVPLVSYYIEPSLKYHGALTVDNVQSYKYCYFIQNPHEIFYKNKAAFIDMKTKKYYDRRANELHAITLNKSDIIPLDRVVALDKMDAIAIEDGRVIALEEMSATILDEYEDMPFEDIEYIFNPIFIKEKKAYVLYEDIMEDEDALSNKEIKTNEDMKNVRSYIEDIIKKRSVMRFSKTEMLKMFVKFSKNIELLNKPMTTEMQYMAYHKIKDEMGIFNNSIFCVS